jgi:hypothetical protein
VLEALIKHGYSVRMNAEDKVKVMNECMVNAMYDVRLLKLLLQHGANPHEFLWKGRPNMGYDERNAWPRVPGVTPLMYAAGLGNIPVLKHLLQLGVDVNKMDYEGSTAFMYATNVGHYQFHPPRPQAIKLLLSYGADPSITKWTPGRGHVTALDLALEWQKMVPENKQSEAKQLIKDLKNAIAVHKY